MGAATSLCRKNQADPENASYRGPSKPPEEVPPLPEAPACAAPVIVPFVIGQRKEHWDYELAADDRTVADLQRRLAAHDPDAAADTEYILIYRSAVLSPSDLLDNVRLAPARAVFVHPRPAEPRPALLASARYLRSVRRFFRPLDDAAAAFPLAVDRAASAGDVRAILGARLDGVDPARVLLFDGGGALGERDALGGLGTAEGEPILFAIQK
jgi:hypothetical protein